VTAGGSGIELDSRMEEGDSCHWDEYRKGSYRVEVERH
jgi:hypothetical protein